MAVISSLELPGSPREASTFAATTFYWDPTAELLTGETISLPVGVVRMYDPSFADNVLDYKVVTATVLSGGAPSIGSGIHANQVQVTFLANTLTIGMEYRIELSCTGSLGSTPNRYFRIRCRV